MLLLLLQCTVSCCYSNIYWCYKQAKLIPHNQISSKNCYKIVMLCYIGLATFIGLKILSNIGYWNIEKISYWCNTKVQGNVLKGPWISGQNTEN